MRMVVHLSDLHFGRVDDALLAPLRECVERIDPSLVVVSGDLTQRARSGQFKAAREYLDTLPRPQLVVPGNHDIPLHNVFKRFVNPLKGFRRHITAELDPFFADDEIAVAGVNTARSLTIKDGRINQDQVALLRERFEALDAHITKIVVTHHPFDLPQDKDNDDLVWRAKMAMREFAKCGADLLLSGHMHLHHVGSTSDRYELGGYAALTIQAGTATSTRGRGENNSFNAICVHGDEIRLDRYQWDGSAFSLHSSRRYEREAQGWREVAAQGAQGSTAPTETVTLTG
ncbi:metallophosphoesterase family protein [Caenimonas aquaedulcis]|uniref:Metallophosphoesterase n=1 Tax=Caenimonas aquaedulcis TaxID=2793270 RepID=A0A931H8G5_9BURK|nr:metallophosphoesterase family protein [Caenimonas aquaedulcis]MBG9390322.1 metallophosphoesterase [Caenimonas aquaedulcis]